MELIFRFIIFGIMIKAVLGTKRNRLKGGKLTSSERMKRYSLIVYKAVVAVNWCPGERLLRKESLLPDSPWE